MKTVVFKEELAKWKRFPADLTKVAKDYGESQKDLVKRVWKEISTSSRCYRVVANRSDLTYSECSKVLTFLNKKGLVDISRFPYVSRNERCPK